MLCPCEQTIKTAHQEGWTRTLMGRYRKLPDIKSAKRALRGHGERAAINTPIQVRGQIPPQIYSILAWLMGRTTPKVLILALIPSSISHWCSPLSLPAPLSGLTPTLCFIEK